MKPALVVLAAGMGSRYGGLKQVDPVGPAGEAILDYSVFDAVRAGFGRVVFVIRRDIEELFKREVGARFERVVDVAYAFQDPADVPDFGVPGFDPAARRKPWGTAHAIRAARTAVDGPFAAINADDFYGREAFAALARFLERPPAAGPLRLAMAAYRLDNTLSENGSVARGVCRVSPAGLLEGVTEMTRIVRAGAGAENREDPARPVPLTGAERVSMNCWGFPRAMLDELERRFPEWLRAHAGDPAAEWYIPFVVDELVREGRAVCEVLPVESRWFGVTYRDDKPAVVSAVAGLVAAGEYPSPLA